MDSARTASTGRPSASAAVSSTRPSPSGAIAARTAAAPACASPDAAERERQLQLARLAVAREGVDRRVEERVEERRVQAVAAGVLEIQRDVGEDVLPAPPGGPDGLELRAVVEAHVGQPVVQRLDRELLRARRWPLCLEIGDVGVLGGERAGRVAHPAGVVVAGGPGEDPDLAPLALAVRADHDLQLERALVGEDERRFEREVGDHGAAGALAGGEREFDQAGARQQDRAEDLVVGDPRMGGERDAARERPAVLAGELEPRAEQRVVEPVVTRGVAGEPEVPALEGVRRQRDRARVRVQGVPVGRQAGEVGVGDHRGEGLGFGALGAQRRCDRRCR